MSPQNKSDSTTEFISIAAHQLRTPLTAIRWTLRGLADEQYGPLTQEQTKAIGGGLKATANATALINDLLEVAHLESNSVAFHCEVQPLNDVLAQALVRARERARRHGLAITARMPERSPCVSLDTERIHLALLNIFDNAIKYTEAPGSILVTIKEKDGWARIAISDSGIGIPTDEQDRLFEKFFRGRDALLRHTSGTGLGLYLVKNIIERHGGVVEIDSVEHKGTTVRMTLPIAS